MTSRKKEYSIKINGVESSIKSIAKLEAAVLALDKAVATNEKATRVTTRTSTTRAKALTDEEKAVRKLETTQKRLAELNSEMGRQQTAATMDLIERRRLLKREIAINELAEGSIRSMGMQITNLRNEYEKLSAEERANLEIGGKMLEQIQSMDAEYKALRESTGNFRDSVGNYEKALGGLGKLESSLRGVTRTNTGLSSSLTQSNGLMALFGGVAVTTGKVQAELARVLALVALAKELNNAATKEGILATGAAIVVDKVRTVQLAAKAKAEALGTKGTIAATAAQKVFNLVASTNPYVLLALLLVGVVAALYSFTRNTQKAADEQKLLNEQQKIWLDYLDAEKASLDLVSNSRAKLMERQISLLQAQGAETSKIRKLEDDLSAERRRNNNRLLGMYGREVEALEENRAKLAEYQKILTAVRLAESAGDRRISIDIDLNGKAEKVKVKDALEIVQAKMDGLGSAIEIAVDLKTDQAELKNAAKIRAALRLTADKEAAEQRADEFARQAEAARAEAQEITALELDALRTAEDLKAKLLVSAFDEKRATVRLTYDREIEDLKTRLETETKLTAEARAAINDQIISLAKIRAQELDQVDKEIAAAEMETRRKLIDQQTALMVGQLDKRLAQINLSADRQIEDLEARLADEVDLTEDQRADLNEMVVLANQERNQELEKADAESLRRRANLELVVIEATLKEAKEGLGTVRTKGGIFGGLIDVDATRANLNASKAALGIYIKDLVGYQADIKAAHLATLGTLKEGTTEYEEEIAKYVAANKDAADKIAKAQEDLAEDTEKAAGLTLENLGEIFEKIGELADIAAQAVTGVFDTWNMGLHASLDSLVDELDVINDHYDQAAKHREQYAKDVEDLEARLQDATGGTAVALREQLADGMHAREQAARDEARLLKDKEKLEAEIAKREKKIKRNDLISNISVGVANTAQGVTKALTLPFPLNLVVAGLVGSMGLVQTGIMTNQLAKLADGGEIVGPSHDQGGVNLNVGGVPSYEAEGGEFMINKTSYGENSGLVNLINDTPGALQLGDIMGLFPGMASGEVMVTEGGNSNESRIVEAIENIKLNPTVSVVDIMQVSSEVTTVRDLADF